MLKLMETLFFKLLCMTPEKVPSRFLKWTLTSGWVCLVLQQTFRRWDRKQRCFKTWINHLDWHAGEAEDRVPDEHVRAEGESADEAENFCQHGRLIIIMLQGHNLICRCPTCCMRGGLVLSLWSQLSLASIQWPSSLTSAIWYIYKLLRMHPDRIHSDSQVPTQMQLPLAGPDWVHHRAGRLRGRRHLWGAVDGDVRDPVGAQHETRSALWVHFTGGMEFSVISFKTLIWIRKAISHVNTRPWILNILPHGQNVFLCPGGDERDGQRRHLWLGGCCPHHWEGQGVCFTAEIKRHWVCVGQPDFSIILNPLRWPPAPWRPEWTKTPKLQQKPPIFIKWSLGPCVSPCVLKQLPGKFLSQSVPISEVLRFASQKGT